MDHSLRRAALGARLEELGADALLVARLLNVRYLTGFTGSNAQLLVTADQAWFFTDGRYTEQSRREAPDLERVTYGNDHLGAVAAKANELGLGRLAVEAHDLTLEQHGKLTKALGKETEVVPRAGAVEGLRAVKDDQEREAIRRAQAATDAAFEAVLDLFAVGVSEAHIALELERLMREEGADGPAFEPIVAFGENSAEPHHRPGHRLLEEGDVIKLDFGAISDGYHSDMTRTVAFGTPATALRKIHDVVRQAQQAGIDAARAGVACSRVDAACREVIEGAGYGDNFVHGTGHGVGLEIHESPWLGKDREEQVPAGSVVTVEPGIYIPGLGGVRIEDMVEVTDDGAVVVGSSTRELIEL